MKDIRDLFFSTYNQFIILNLLSGGLRFQVEYILQSTQNYYLNIRLLRSVLHQPNPFFITWNKLKLSFLGGGGVTQTPWMVSTMFNQYVLQRKTFQPRSYIRDQYIRQVHQKCPSYLRFYLIFKLHQWVSVEVDFYDDTVRVDCY